VFETQTTPPAARTTRLAFRAIKAGHEYRRGSQLSRIRGLVRSCWWVSVLLQVAFAWGISHFFAARLGLVSRRVHHCGVMGINYQTHTRVIYVHNTLCEYVRIMSACLLLLCIASHRELPPWHFLLALVTAVPSFMRLWCSWVRYPGWPGAQARCVSQVRLPLRYAYVYM
jgi:hypothetical protein